jgi:hypothetical protein
MSEDTPPTKLSYYERNKEKLLNKQKEYNKLNYAKNTERNKKYYNKEYYRLYYHSHISPKRLHDESPPQ